MKKRIVSAIFIITGAIGAMAFNLFFLERLFIPDPCYYRSHEGGWLFRLYYDLPADEGFHPVPSLFNLIFTVIAGGLAGYWISKSLRLLKK